MKSCAMPPASCPTLSSRCDWRSCASSRLRSVTLRLFSTMPCTSGSSSWPVAVVSTSIQVPSAALMRHSTGLPGASSRATAAMNSIDPGAVLGVDQELERRALVTALGEHQRALHGRAREHDLPPESITVTCPTSC